jgi:hypothetical protein
VFQDPNDTEKKFEIKYSGFAGRALSSMENRLKIDNINWILPYAGVKFKAATQPMAQKYSDDEEFFGDTEYFADIDDFLIKTDGKDAFDALKKVAISEADIDNDDEKLFNDIDDFLITNDGPKALGALEKQAFTEVDINIVRVDNNYKILDLIYQNRKDSTQLELAQLQSDSVVQKALRTFEPTLYWDEDDVTIDQIKIAHLQNLFKKTADGKTEVDFTLKQQNTNSNFVQQPVQATMGSVPVVSHRQDTSINTQFELIQPPKMSGAQATTLPITDPSATSSAMLPSSSSNHLAFPAQSFKAQTDLLNINLAISESGAAIRFSDIGEEQTSYSFFIDSEHLLNLQYLLQNNSESFMGLNAQQLNDLIIQKVAQSSDSASLPSTEKYLAIKDSEGMGVPPIMNIPPIIQEKHDIQTVSIDALDLAGYATSSKSKSSEYDLASQDDSSISYKSTEDQETKSPRTFEQTLDWDEDDFAIDPTKIAHLQNLFRKTEDDKKEVDFTLKQQETSSNFLQEPLQKQSEPKHTTIGNEHQSKKQKHKKKGKPTKEELDILHSLFAPAPVVTHRQDDDYNEYNELDSNGLDSIEEKYSSEISKAEMSNANQIEHKQKTSSKGQVNKDFLRQNAKQSHRDREHTQPLGVIDKSGILDGEDASGSTQPLIEEKLALQEESKATTTSNISQESINLEELLFGDTNTGSMPVMPFTQDTSNNENVQTESELEDELEHKQEITEETIVTLASGSEEKPKTVSPDNSSTQIDATPQEKSSGNHSVSIDALDVVGHTQKSELSKSSSSKDDSSISYKPTYNILAINQTRTHIGLDKQNNTHNSTSWSMDTNNNETDDSESRHYLEIFPHNSRNKTTPIPTSQTTPETNLEQQSISYAINSMSVDHISSIDLTSTLDFSTNLSSEINNFIDAATGVMEASSKEIISDRMSDSLEIGPVSDIGAEIGIESEEIANPNTISIEKDKGNFEPNGLFYGGPTGSKQTNINNQSQESTIILKPEASSVKNSDVKQDLNAPEGSNNVKGSTKKIGTKGVSSGSEDNMLPLPKTGFWAKAAFGKAAQSKDKKNPAFNMSQVGVTGGFDFTFAENIVIGAAVGHNETKLAPEIGLQTNINDNTISLYSAARLKDRLLLTCQIGGSSFSSVKNTKNHDPKLSSKFVATSLKYAIHLGQGLVFSPKAGVDFINITSEDKTKDDKTLSSNLGLSLSKKFKLGNGGMFLTPEIHGGFGFVLNGKERKHDAMLGRILSNNPDKGMKHMFGASFKLEGTDRLELDAGYDYTGWDKFVSHQGYLQVKLKF